MVKAIDGVPIPIGYQSGAKAMVWFAGYKAGKKRQPKELSILSAAGFLAQVEDLLDGREWDASTIETVAGLARLAGAVIRDPDEIETRSPEWMAGYDHGRAQCNHHHSAGEMS